MRSCQVKREVKGKEGWEGIGGVCKSSSIQISSVPYFDTVVANLRAATIFHNYLGR